MKKFINSLPKKPDILGRKQYHNAAVLVPFLHIEDSYHILFEKRANHIRQGGEISFPGGTIDEDMQETAQEAAFRETQEELGITQEKLQIYKQFHTLVTAHGTIVEVFIGELFCPLEQMNINQNEVESIFTVPVRFFLHTEPEKYEMKVIMSPYETSENKQRKILFPAEELAVPKKYRESWSRKNSPVYVYHFGEEIIWGMTAQILVELIPFLRYFSRVY